MVERIMTMKTKKIYANMMLLVGLVWLLLTGLGNSSQAWAGATDSMGKKAAHFPAPVRQTQYIEGYTDKHSYAPGDTIHFHVSTNAPTFGIKVTRITFPWWDYTSSVATITGLPGAFYPMPPQAWLGANWPTSYDMVVGQDWTSGAYLAQFVAEDGSVRYHPFYVRPAVPGATSRIAYLGNFTTLAAYNLWGGKYFYSQPRIYKASLLRPFFLADGKGRSSWNLRMLSHLENMGYVLEYITEQDIEEHPDILRNYDVVVLAGHHEYVSTTVYDALQDHHDRGGHLALFDADELYWQVRYENNGDTVVCYKEESEDNDPLFGFYNCRVTEAWGSDILNRPAEKLRGIQKNSLYAYFESGEYVVENAAHWIFEGTGVQNGDTFGTMMAQGEQDTIKDDSPQLDIILHGHRDVVKQGKVPPHGETAAEMYAIYYADTPEYGHPNGNGGMVFAAGTISGWVRALFNQPDSPKVQRATMNIIDAMLANPPSPSNGDPILKYCDPCFVDINGDGVVNTNDFIVFLNLWNANNPVTDWNHDGEVNTADFTAYINDWVTKC